MTWKNNWRAVLSWIYVAWYINITSRHNHCQEYLLCIKIYNSWPRPTGSLLNKANAKEEWSNELNMWCMVWKMIQMSAVKLMMMRCWTRDSKTYVWARKPVTLQPATIAVRLLQYRLYLIGLFGLSTGTLIAEGNAQLQLQSATTIWHDEAMEGWFEDTK